MSNYFILEIESLSQTFTIVDSGKTITFELLTQDNKEQFKNIQLGDFIFCYYNKPIDMIKVLFKVKSVDSENKIKIEKLLDVKLGVKIKDKNLLYSLHKNKITSIESNKFKDIYNELIENQSENIKNENIENTSDCKELKIKDNIFKKLDDILFDSPKLPVPYNYLIFGAPGTGKSNKIKRMQKKYFKDEDCFERVTFHSNYSYANFVGTYKPKMDKNNIIYTYVSGPFIRILEKCYKNPNKNYLLIIEEINRANVAAVFGDIFQLLDRDEGKSEYSIETSDDLKLYLAERFVSDFKNIDDKNEKEKILSMFQKIYIPSNMYIWATMNSADQGVYPMDTAFKRRWSFEYIGIDENEENMSNVNILLNGGKKKLNWNQLRHAINRQLSNKNINEDKLLGPYFLSKEIIKENENNTEHFVEDNDRFLKEFKSKVLMYLFEDVCKQHKDFIFNNKEHDIKRYSSICETFDKEGLEVFVDDISKSVDVTDIQLKEKEVENNEQKDESVITK